VNRFLCISALAILFLAGLSSHAHADAVVGGERQWTGAKIQQIQDGRLWFTDQNGARQAVLLTTVQKLQVDLREELNLAEDLRSRGQGEEAVRAYEAALRTESRSDLADLIRWRLMDLYGRSGQLDRAVEMFVDLIKRPDFQQVAKDWRPANLAAVRPKLRDSAIAILDSSLRQIRTGLASEYVRQLRDHIAAGGATQPDGGPSAASQTPAIASGPARADAGTWIARATGWLKQGEYDRARQAADQLLASQVLPRNQLEDALYVRAVASWHLAKDQDRLLQAGWALSRLIIEFPGSQYYPECQYYLGLVHQRMGRAELARRSFQQAQAHPETSAEIKERARKAYLDIVVEQSK